MGAACRDAERLLEPRLAPEPCEKSKPRERRRQRDREPQRHVAEPVVPEFMRKYSLQLGGGQRRDQRVEEHDALVAPEPGEVGVAVRAAPRTVHDVDAARLESAAARKRLDSVAQGPWLQLAETVEQRRDETRPGPADEDRERGPGANANTHQAGPARCMSHRNSAASGNRSRAPTASPLSASAANSAGVVRLKPKRASMRNVRQASKGRPTSAINRPNAATVVTCCASAAGTMRGRGGVDRRDAAADC